MATSFHVSVLRTLCLSAKKKKKWKNEFVTPLLTELIKCKLATVTGEKKPSDLPVNARNGCQLCLQYQLHLLLPHHRRSFFGSYSFHFFGRKKKTRFCEKWEYESREIFTGFLLLACPVSGLVCSKGE